MSAFLLKSTYERQETIPNIQPFYNTKKYLTNTKTTPIQPKIHPIFLYNTHIIPNKIKLST